MSDFPNSEVLIARGKYATINSERKATIKELRSHLESIMGYAGRLMRAVELRTEEETDFAEERMAAAMQRLELARLALSRCNALKQHLDELRPIAWEKTKEPA